MRSFLLAAAGVAALACGTAIAQPAPMLSAGKAVELAEKALSARATEVELDRRNGRPVYDVELVRNGTLYEAEVDARTGQLLSSERQRLESLWAGWFDKARLEAPSRPLGAVLTSIEAETGGRVDEISVDREGGRPIYEVELTTAAGTAAIAVDAATGQRLPPALAD